MVSKNSPINFSFRFTRSCWQVVHANTELMIAKTPPPPYYTVIFTSTRTEGDNGYSAMADRMVELAAEQEGFLGIDSAREDIGITVSYWQSLDAIRNWKQNAEHLEAQRLGRESWYSDFMLRVAKVERDYGM